MAINTYDTIIYKIRVTQDQHIIASELLYTDAILRITTFIFYINTVAYMVSLIKHDENDTFPKTQSITYLTLMRLIKQHLCSIQ